MFLGAFNDLVLDFDANELAAEFVRRKIRQIVHDPDVAELLTPKSLIGCKRLCVDSGYYETFNRDDVTLVDISTTPISEITPTSLRVGDEEYTVDDLVLATGFDAMTGALLAVDIRGRGGRALADAWRDGPCTYLGLGVAEFPNLFTISGPGSPSALTNMFVSIEQHVDFIADCIDYLRAQRVPDDRTHGRRAGRLGGTRADDRGLHRLSALQLVVPRRQRPGQAARVHDRCSDSRPTWRSAARSRRTATKASSSRTPRCRALLGATELQFARPSASARG